MAPSKKRGGDDTLETSGHGSGSSKAMKCNDDDDEPFASDDDEIPDECAKGNHLSWRKENSFSDWTIIITVTNPCEEEDSDSDEEDSDDESENKSDCDDGPEGTAYHVHKERLAIGPRRSGYFVHLFHGKFTESHDNTSRIELNKLAANAFPDFLDYMYMTGQKMKFKTENATALCSLAKYFDVRRLRHEAKQFYLQDICKTTWCTYYVHAKKLQEEGILQAATKFLGSNIQNFHLNNDIEIMLHIVKITDTQFWLDLMEESKEQGTISNISRKLSIFITCFCYFHAPCPEVFTQLTHEKYLGDGGINSMAAALFLDLERKILGEDRNAANGQPHQLSNLQIRCVNAIVRLGNSKKSSLVNGFATKFQNFPPLVLSEIIKRSFSGIPTTEEQQQHQQPQ